ncbi:glycerophosphodiester phosphodiesterase family protein [Rhizobium sp. RM]|uniref:glycerophosphodiester phosphodiesterase family protein n=1 Tax=Rhizobium sp. RM TaxID=2748079 RepID=UPI00110E9605|nr:glycerophosphodiester phosphodiesterase family protein [Rhizobium sp. RM]NWJ23533.1 glycerophosphodiester phosphodiesterase family protein [Rhizobium sp. RM]TMV19264.1 glycerophosphodiester phosphodiesterase family protein [Rhizobium sp. Td3]
MTHYQDYIADPKRAPAIVAHRGAWRGAPENSLAAIERAIAVGANIVELDIRKSADGELFIMHDDTLLRMAGIDRDAETFTMAELQAIALREDDGGEGRAVSDQRIPTLKQALEIIRGRIFADLDLKDRGLFPEVAACARAMQATSYVDLKTRVMTRDELDWVQDQNIDGVPFMAMAKFTAGEFHDTMALLSEIKPFMCEMRFDRIETIVENRDLFREANMALWINTLDQVGSGEWRDDKAMIDPDSIWGRLMDAGISVFQTDQPEALKVYIEARQA